MRTIKSPLEVHEVYHHLYNRGWREKKGPPWEKAARIYGCGLGKGVRRGCTDGRGGAAVRFKRENREEAWVSNIDVESNR